VGVLLFLRFWAAAGALWITAVMVGGMTITPLGAIVLALVLAAVGAVAERLWPLHGPGTSGLGGWLAASVVLWLAQYVVPFYHVTALGALVAGGLLWLLDQFIPVVFG
jgi:hypothetical protein